MPINHYDMYSFAILQLKEDGYCYQRFPVLDGLNDLREDILRKIPNS